jgi:hypothetical protein
MTTGIGHNNGPTLEPGFGWRRHCWREARRDLLARLPIEILRHRVKRAKELGLDYKSYASIRATSGHDVVAFLFSTNALRLLAAKARVPQDRIKKLAGLKNCGTLIAAHRPLTPAAVARTLRAQGIEFNATAEAPGLWHNWPQTRTMLREIVAAGKFPADGVVVVGDTVLEHSWCAAGHLAGYLDAGQYFIRPR